ncbi:hypothetical protein V1512DRAFT_260945 [Lipomyces arxii]|uniref:uncharacterized protein n=1 Tax=Lipomyces arxii TaxID=56418 RepID=UPI0034CFA4DB
METSIRSLLRQQEAVKKVEHPFAQYTGNRLKCSICDLFISSDSQWEAHLGTKTHRNEVQKYKSAQQRKAKRALDKEEESENIDVSSTETKRRRSNAETDIGLNASIGSANIEDEWAAFQRDIATLDAGTVAQATAVVRDANSTTTEEQQDTVADDLEEFQNDLQDQFDEQKELEARVSKLRELRKELQSKRFATVTKPLEADGKTTNGTLTEVEKEDGDLDENLDDENFDDFKFWHKKSLR